ncbi:MAG: hypothetical protein ACP5RH_01550 [Leptodesmis sp.]|uniref:hypothetical protein n=1 Tax=Leptodesmis sp. TaxID=3100501 RepID=UPI003D0E4EA8
MADRTLQLILRVSNEAAKEVQQIKRELQDLLKESERFQSSKFNTDQFKGLGKDLGEARKGFEGLREAAGKALGGGSGAAGLLGSVAAGAGGAVSAVVGISFAFNQVTQAIQTALGALTPFYDALIASNERLNAQILSSQTNLASSTRIFQDGKELTDPTTKILATRAQISAAIKQIEKDTQELVGVTSSQVNELFQITLTNAAQLNKQSKEFPGPIEAATSLTKGWAASLKVLGVPLDQARQEINSILKGQIDQNSILAKNLNVTNQQVERWRANGELVDRLNDRLKVFVAGNAIAARSVDGIGSNIKDLFEVITREGGKPLLEPVIQVLAFTENAIKSVQPQLIGALAGISQGIADVFTGLGAAFKPALDQVGNSLKGLFDSLGELFSELKEGFGPGLSAAFSGAAQVIASVLGGAISGVVKIARVLIDVLTFAANNPAIQAGFNAIGKTVGFIGSAIAGAIKIFTDAGNTITDALSGVLNFFRGFQDVAEIIGAIGGSVLGGVVQKAVEVAKAIVEAFVPVKEIGAIFNAAKNAAAGALKAIQDAFSGAFNSIGDLVKGAFKGIADQLTGLVKNPAFQAIAKALNINTEELSKRLSEIEGKYKAVGEAAKGAGKDAKEVKDAGSLEIKARQAPELGTQFDQIKQKLESTKRIFEEAPEGEEFTNAVKTRIKLLEEAASKGIISAQDAESELNAIRNNIRVETELQEQAAQTAIKVNKNALDIKLMDFKATQAEIEAQIKSGQLNEEEGAKRLNAAKGNLLQAQLDNVREQLRKEQDAIERGSGSKSRADQLRNQEREIQAQIEAERAAGRDREAQARDKETSLVKKELQAQIQAIQASMEVGTIKSAEGARRITELKKQELDKQLADLKLAIMEEEKAQVPGKTSPRLRELRAEQEKLLADRKTAEVQGEREIQEAILRDLDKAQAKATSVTKLAETERQIEIQKLIKSGVLTKEEAEKAKLDATRKSIEAELKLEKEKLAQLQALPTSSDPQIEEERQQKIRDSKQRTADLTLKLVENEKNQQTYLLEKIKKQQDEIALRAKNAQEQQKIAFQAQSQLLESANKILERRSQLLEAQKNLVKSASDLQQSGYKNAIDLLQSEFDTEDKILDRQKQREELQKRVAEGDTGAAEELAALDRREARERQIINLKIEAKQAELVALNQQQALEQQSLILEEQKTNLLQRQEEIRLRIALADAKSQAAQAVADAAKIAADPNATAGQKEAAQIAVKAAQQKVEFAQEAIVLQKTLSAATEGEFAARRQTLANQQQQQRSEKQIELQTLQNQQFGLSPLNQGSPEEQANQRAVAAEDFARRQSVAAEEARARGYSTPLQQVQQARSPIESLASQQTIILAESKSLQVKQNEYLAKLVELSSGKGGTGVNNTFNISGEIDPKGAASIAYKKIEEALCKALVKAGTK